ncbi:hypothetical protein [Bacillus pseudomycoides]|uniref:hypothetical protein n=1 Tax=Bacillus pseudomycoides TaxID=64104 RepID=UPI0023DA0244|nr:hypothetical protein [Bacillus pseudomycoides]MDF2084639.1 hypothetical protein [Bacillus pseudomycoides]
MNQNKYLRTKLSTLDKRKNPELLRFELFSCIVALVYSDYFERNVEIRNFLGTVGIEFKDYVFDSKTLIIARTTKSVKEFKVEELYVLLDGMKELVFNDFIEENKKTNTPKQGENYVDSLLDQFTRRK